MQVCMKCGYPIIIRKLKIKGMDMELKTKCPNGHEDKFYLPVNQQTSFINDITEKIYRCKKCGSGLLPIADLKYEDHYVKFKVVCNIHGSDSRKVEASFYPIIETAYRAIMGVAMQQPQQNPTCPKCHSSVQWIAQYNRWYCSYCKEYV